MDLSFLGISNVEVESLPSAAAGKAASAVTYLTVPYREKDEAKALGARWDASARKWYIDSSADRTQFAKWLPSVMMTYSDLSDEQQHMIERVRTGHNILVDACIGSGKTTTIQVLCNELPEKRILYLTYNFLLKDDAQKKITSPNVLVQNYHGFAAKILYQNGLKAGVSDMIQLFNAKRFDVGSYDLLLLDEYQDIDTEISELLQIIKDQNPHMQIVAVGDMAQKIYNKTTLDISEFIGRFLGCHEQVRFSKCFRLSEAHADRLGNIWLKRIEGVNPSCEILEMDRFEAEAFIEKQKVSDILCLGSRKGQMSDVLNSLERRCRDKFNKNTVYASISDEDRTNLNVSQAAIFTTFDGCKGMERNICVVFDFDASFWDVRCKMQFANQNILRNVFCVAASRGKRKIIFVKPKDGGLFGTSFLESNVLRETVDYDAPYSDQDVSTMFDFKYKEQIEDAYHLLHFEKEDLSDASEIQIDSKDGLIDLSPCIGNYQSAVFFKNYNVDDCIAYCSKHVKDYMPPVDYKDCRTKQQKLLYLTCYETTQDRYLQQVSVPFVDKKQKSQIIERMYTLFDGDETVEQECTIPFVGEFSIHGRADVIKDDAVYELKFVSELKHEYFLQCALYMVMFHLEIGYLWNIRKNELYMITIPDEKAFMDAVIKAATKGQVEHYSFKRIEERREADAAMKAYKMEEEGQVKSAEDAYRELLSRPAQFGFM